MIQSIPDTLTEHVITPDQWIFEDRRFKSPTLRPNGDWRDFLPKYEDQFKNGFESSACSIMHVLNPLEILLKERFNLDEDFAERFTAVMAGLKRNGGDQHEAAEAVRKHGVVEDALLPFSEAITSYEEFIAPISPSLVAEGRNWLKQWVFNHDWVFKPDASQADRERLMLDALKYSPLSATVTAWRSNGDVYLDMHTKKNHLVTIVYGELDSEGGLVCWHAFDSYYPYMKRLAPDFTFGSAKRYAIRRATWWDNFKRLLF